MPALKNPKHKRFESGHDPYMSIVTTPKVNLITPKKKEEFIGDFRTTGNITKSARNLGLTRQAIYQWMEKDEAFKEAVDNAAEEALDLMEAECKRRAEEGCDRPVFYQGNECGAIREYSDTLMMFFLKGNRPDKYKDRTDINVTGTLTVKPEELTDEQLAQIIKRESKGLPEPEVVDLEVLPD